MRKHLRRFWRRQQLLDGFIHGYVVGSMVGGWVAAAASASLAASTGDVVWLWMTLAFGAIAILATSMWWHGT